MNLEIFALQQWLVQQGHSLAVDGIWGPVTRKAFKQTYAKIVGRGTSDESAVFALTFFDSIGGLGSSITRSPNRGGFRDRVSAIILHQTEGSWDSVINHFSNRISRVSAHYLIGRSGKVCNFVPEDITAWHAAGWNSKSIGIEVECTKEQDWTEEEWTALEKLVGGLLKRWKITEIKLHREVNPTKCPASIDTERVEDFKKKVLKGK